VRRSAAPSEAPQSLDTLTRQFKGHIRSKVGNQMHDTLKNLIAVVLLRNAPR
jgi:hypothetical protein